MENEVKLTKLASCAGCGAKVGAGTLCNLLEGFQTHYDDLPHKPWHSRRAKSPAPYPCPSSQECT